MFVTDPATFLAEVASGRYPARHPPTARAAFLVAPAGGGVATESATDNRYMDLATAPDPARAASEHAELARRLGEDVPVLTFAGAADCPDGMFPNNVFASTRGQLIVGRMRHAVRRREAKRADIRAFFGDLLGRRIVDLSQCAFVAELTGSLVIDHARGIGYCGLSERCDEAGARAMHAAFGLAMTFCFELAADEYHTNVVLAILAGRMAMIAPGGFRDGAVPAAIERAFEGRVISLDERQKRDYAGNAITLSPQRVWLSARGAAALDGTQRAALAADGFELGSVPLVEIEKAGGSLRCCVAEIF